MKPQPRMFACVMRLACSEYAESTHDSRNILKTGEVMWLRWLMVNTVPTCCVDLQGGCYRALRLLHEPWELPSQPHLVLQYAAKDPLQALV